MAASQFRVVLWNCNNGMASSEQIDYFKSLRADLDILPELKRGNVDQLGSCSWAWMTNNHTNRSPKGLGVIGFGDVEIEELERDVDMELYLPLKVRTPAISFNLVAVWNFYYACKQGRFKGVRGDGALEWSAIAHYASRLAGPCLFGGDWNFGPTFSKAAFLRLCKMFDQYGYESLYHRYYSLSPNETDHHTFRTSRGHLHHLDHLFATNDLAAQMASYDVIPVNTAVRSDHSPVILTLNLSDRS